MLGGEFKRSLFETAGDFRVTKCAGITNILDASGDRPFDGKVVYGMATSEVYSKQRAISGLQNALELRIF